MSNVYRTFLCVAAFCLTALFRWQSQAAESSLTAGLAERYRTIPLTGVSCGPLPGLQISPDVPSDIQLSPNFNLVQRSADLFSWQEFIGLNWPAKEGVRGVPASDRPFNVDGPRVWETWKEEYEVYLPDGSAPASWDSPEPVPPGCGGNTKRLSRAQKIDDVVDSVLQAAASTGTLPATLTDQQKHVVRYEIRMNKVMFDYIVQHQLYNANIQKDVDSVSFPPGAILIKAAWREVTAEEESLYHTVTACVCDQEPNGQFTHCETKRMGLVGLHITQKTPNAPQWIWSTFEQVNNVPGPRVKGKPSFDNRACLSCPVNRQTPTGIPNQIRRTDPIPSEEPDCDKPRQALDNVRLLNSNVEQAMIEEKSVFQNYQLINTQWPVPPISRQPTTVFRVLPTVLANTTMESFVQPTSSCMGCHSTARTVNPVAFVSADFSFTLNNARPAVKNPNVIPPPSQPATSWDQTNWTAIIRGYQLTTQTYEILTNNVPKAKLHCSSCHLDAGGNMAAAWWVNLEQRYTNLASLQNRINGCFERSMNGYPLCTPQGFATPGNPAPCTGDTNMTALTTYMSWLTEQWNNSSTTNRGFPPIATLKGNSRAGESIFVQKCAVCHNLDGQGRYLDNVYYRPALWGPNSFNQSAGMFSNPGDLAAFIRWNMPLGAGGMLTDQEAWNLEAYIHSKRRPKKP
ncbi:MAG TPA: c-type cytochrome [Candidatus Limnocylindria bacterium]|nr:c-type cytochrome [Candidatus Limnocylindria bacterium]